MKTEASKYDFIFVPGLIDDGDSFHFENGGWEVLLETESPVKSKADADRVVLAVLAWESALTPSRKAAKPGGGRGDEGFCSISAFRFQNFSFPNIDADKFPAQTDGA
jgi:hypothetical protein